MSTAKSKPVRGRKPAKITVRSINKPPYSAALVIAQLLFDREKAKEYLEVTK